MSVVANRVEEGTSTSEPAISLEAATSSALSPTSNAVTLTIDLSLSLSLSAVTHAPFHASVLRPTSWPNARDRRDGEVN